MEAISSMRPALIVGVSAVLGLLFDYFFFGQIPGIGFTVFVAAIVIGFIAISMYSDKPLKKDFYWLFPLLLFFALMVAIRSNLLLTALNVVGCALLLLLIVEVNVRDTVRSFIPTDYLKLLFPPYKFVDPLLKTLSDVLSKGKQYKDHKKAGQVIRGIAITAPIVILFTILLSSADPIFGEYFSVFNVNFDGEIVFRIFLGAAVAIICVGAYSYAMFGTPEAQSQQAGKRDFGLIETTILLGSINVLFFAFILVQTTYLFGGEANIISHGMTYAEYARRGFFELVAIAVLSYLILLATEKYIERNVEEHSKQFKILSTVLVLQLAVLMVSAFLRLSLYEETYGFTTLRVYVHAFIVFMGVIFSFLLYKILIENKDNTFAFRVFLAIVVFVAGMNLFNPDAFIAQKNIERYEATGKLDAEYISYLSADATETKLRVLEIDNPDIQGVIGRSLYESHEYYSRNEQPWQSWNFARENERRLLKENADKLGLYRNYEARRGEVIVED
ncbi:DUF4173 domain-containing protein [Candidatus Kaiserbacteria bacterium]|nr:DUF4173 domain-containing protein [Candidatus Kaiserbacteria bacterium]